jgi:hypothetical protein
VVPFEAVVNVLGDPRSDDEAQPFTDEDGNKGVVVRRDQEMSRLFARYGVVGEDPEALRKGHQTIMDKDKGDVSHPTVPLLFVTHPETNEPITFPAQDPTMVSYPVPQNGQQIMTDPKREITRLQKQNRDLTENFDRLTALVEGLLADKAEGLTTGD